MADATIHTRTQTSTVFNVTNFCTRACIPISVQTRKPKWTINQHTHQTLKTNEGHVTTHIPSGRLPLRYLRGKTQKSLTEIKAELHRLHFQGGYCALENPKNTPSSKRGKQIQKVFRVCIDGSISALWKISFAGWWEKEQCNSCNQIAMRMVAWLPTFQATAWWLWSIGGSTWIAVS